MDNLLAQNKLCLPGQPTCIEDQLPTGRFNTPADVISVGLTFIFPIAGLILFINLVWGGFQYLVSQGDEKAISGAKGRITMSLVGFIVLIAGFWITQLIASILHIRGPF